jgi:Protein of unknown function (DUF3168)
VSTYLLKTYPDVEGAVRTWLRLVPSVAAIVGSRVFFAIPDNTEWPLIVVTQQGGGPDVSDAPFTTDLIQLDCWAPPSPPSKKPSKADCAALKLAVVGALESMIDGTHMGSTAIGMGAHVLSALWRPDYDANQGRYVVTAQVSARAA